jgi:hypothetical protein
MMPALKELAFMLGFHDSGAEQFTWPAQGTSLEPDLLYRACWGLALLTEVYRRGPATVAVRLPPRSGLSAVCRAGQPGRCWKRRRMPGLSKWPRSGA